MLSNERSSGSAVLWMQGGDKGVLANKEQWRLEKS